MELTGYWFNQRKAMKMNDKNLTMSVKDNKNRSAVVGGFLLFLFYILSTAANAQTIYITNTGEKYHTGSCRYLHSSKIQTTLAEAKADGYEACKVCKPPTVVSASPSKQPPAKTNADPNAKRAIQCIAYNSNGTRCDQMTTATNGKCSIHK